jgi:hypothetical protein
VRSAALAKPDKRNREGEAENAARLAAVDARIAIVDIELAANLPDYSASPALLSVEKVQAQLAADEVLYCISIHRIKASQLSTWCPKTTDQVLINIFTRRLRHVDGETAGTIVKRARPECGESVGWLNQLRKTPTLGANLAAC